MTIQYQINGYLVGNAWMPSAECYKPLAYRFVREDSFRPSPFSDTQETLRDAMLEATRDGDFQSCDVADGFLTITKTVQRGATMRKVSRHFPLSMFASVSDMVRNDWDGPNVDD
jgi:hypothetical protein